MQTFKNVPIFKPKLCLFSQNINKFQMKFKNLHKYKNHKNSNFSLNFKKENK